MKPVFTPQGGEIKQQFGFTETLRTGSTIFQFKQLAGFRERKQEVLSVHPAPPTHTCSLSH